MVEYPGAFSAALLIVYCLGARTYLYLAHGFRKLSSPTGRLAKEFSESTVAHQAAAGANSLGKRPFKASISQPS